MGGPEKEQRADHHKCRFEIDSLSAELNRVRMDRADHHRTRLAAEARADRAERTITKMIKSFEEYKALVTEIVTYLELKLCVAYPEYDKEPKAIDLINRFN